MELPVGLKGLAVHDNWIPAAVAVAVNGVLMSSGDGTA
jgi:hypothetical protein